MDTEASEETPLVERLESLLVLVDPFPESPLERGGDVPWGFFIFGFFIAM